MTITIGAYALTWAVGLLFLLNVGGVIFIFHFWRMVMHLIDAHNGLASEFKEHIGAKVQEVNTQVIGFKGGE